MDILIAKFGPGMEAASGSDTVPLQHWKYMQAHNGRDRMRLLAGLNFYTDKEPWDSGYNVVSRNGGDETATRYDNFDALYESVISNPPDVLHTHTRGKNLVELARELKKRGTKIVHTVHGMDSLGDRYDLQLFGLADAITSPTQYACRGISGIRGGRYAHKTLAIPNSTDFTDYKWDETVQQYADELRKAHAQSGRIVLTTGRLQEDKGVFELGQAVIELVKEGRDLVYMHAGMVFDPKDQERLERMFREHDVDDRLVLLGKVEPVQEQRTLASIYWASDVFVLPSDGLYENFPMSALEALAMEKPAIVSNLGGPMEAYVNSKLAIGVPPRNVGKIREALRYVINNYDYEKERARFASRLIDAQYHSRVISYVLHELYRKLVTGATNGNTDDVIIPENPRNDPFMTSVFK